MSLTILFAHTGAQLEVDPRSLNSLDSLKTWIARHSNIPVTRQILMTGKGKPVKLQNLLTEREIFVYDRELLSPRPSGQVSTKTTRPIPSPYLPQQAPDVLSDQTSLDAWQRLFKDRESWAIQIAKAGDAMIQKISLYSVEIDIIRRATIVAAANPRQHIESIQQKYDDAERWVQSIIQDQARLATQTDRNLAASKRITTFDVLTKAISTSGAGGTTGKGTLDSLFDRSALDLAKKRSLKTVTMIRQRLEDVKSLYEDVIHDGEDLNKQVESRLGALSEDVTETINSLVDEMDVCVRQIKADCGNTMRSGRDARSVAAVSKTALLHTKKFLPSLYDTAIDIGELLRRSAERRNSIEDMALHFLQRTSTIESSLASVQTKMRNIDLEPEDDTAFDTLGRGVQYPSIYGSLLVEIVRRQQWNQKMLTGTSTLAEEMAGFREEEEKRRRKWRKTVDGFVVPDAFNHRARGVEINISGHEQNWPALSRDDINTLIQEFEAVGGFEETVQEILGWLKELDAPSRTQPRKANTFRNGALNESAYGGNSLLLRDDDELVNTLQNDKVKLEDRLKGSESRIRKLEDLLYRSSQMARPFAGSSGPSIGNIQAPGMERNRSSSGVGHAVSPRLNDSLSRRSSVASHRLSINHAQDDNAMLQRCTQLEAELMSERKRLAQFEQSAVVQIEMEDELRRQIEDASVMKKDLMDNFQSQQRDFEAERKMLEEEIKKIKIKQEEMEEEYERVLGSHDNTRGAYSEMAKEHEVAVKNLQADALKDLEQAHDRIGNLQTVNDNQRNRLNILEDESYHHTNLISSLRQELEQQTITRDDQQKILYKTHTLLDPESGVPSTFSELVQNLEIISQKALNQNKDLRLISDAVRGQNEALEAKFRTKEADMIKLRESMFEKEKDMLAVKESFVISEAKANVLEQELAKERETLKSLRAQLPGSEAVKLQLTEASQRAEELRLKLATVQASNNQSGAEIFKHLKSIESLQKTNDHTSTKLLDRAQRARRSLLTSLFANRPFDAFA